MIPFFKQRKSSTLTPQHLLSQQVQWQHPAIIQGDIDQTRLVIADAPANNKSSSSRDGSSNSGEGFSFLVIGDTDGGDPATDNGSFSQGFASQVTHQLKDNRFIIHTGDVAYPTGSYQNYLTRFLRPYQALLSHLPQSPTYEAQDIIFNKALLSVPGNHDYSCDTSRIRYWHYLLQQACDRLRKTTGIDLGHYGGERGEAYGQTFLDSLADLSTEQLKAHLLAHYSAQADNPASARPQHCLSYQPGIFTRLPNRYYSFRYGGVDFFALDSNTWQTSPNQPGFDQAQLDWLKESLIRSWQTPETVGRIVYLHHSPYTTEAHHWQSANTLWIRRHLRSVFKKVAMAKPFLEKTAEPGATPVVDLVLSGHAHCFEHLKSTSTNLGDRNIDWVVCGGSGASVRRQRQGESDILERIAINNRQQTKVVAKSQQFVGHHGSSHKQQKLHSFIQVDIQPNHSQKIIVQPFVVRKVRNHWQTTQLSPLLIGQPNVAIKPEMATV